MGAALNLYHYFDKSVGPFVSLSDLPKEEAEAILKKIKQTKPNTQSATRQSAYVNRRREIEDILKTQFIKKGGVVKRRTPHYMVIEHSPWLSSWFENGSFIKIPFNEFDLTTVSFTYGDAFPVFSESKHQMDGKEYRRQVYVYDEILELISRYGLPQEWNDDGARGPERYIKAHVWNENPIGKYRAVFPSN